MPDAELSLPAGRAFLSTLSPCTLSYCKVPETCRSWQETASVVSHGENTIRHGLCPRASLRAIGQTSDESLRCKWPVKLPYSGCSLLFVSGTPPPFPYSVSLPCPPFPVLILQWVLSHSHFASLYSFMQAPCL